jgi:hypothetical protein
MLMEKEIILDSRYKYVFDSELNRMRIHIYGNPCPLVPPKLYKFYNTNLLSIASLQDSYFWLSNPKEFNDPFDCNINLIEHNNQKALNKITSSKKNDISNIGVTCFTEVLDEPLMWAHYANNFYGFVLELDSNHLRVNLYNRERKKSLNPVLYFKQFIKVKNTDSFALEYFLTAKSDKWEYEKEWRILADVDDNIPYDRIAPYEPITIKAIYIGHRLFEENESVFNLVESIFLQKYPDKPTYIVYPHPYKLELIFQQRMDIKNES